MPAFDAMEKIGDSLFSLELVVEKLYVPHAVCRFPAVAFRLLDFPTILIKHVEDDLAKAINQKISFDPAYQLPTQFSELKDRHGNFVIKKGKSCLFKMECDILKQHLATTPMYVMVIDLFPEVPKLVGNSTVPLNATMDQIAVDVAKLGPTVPAVHGDKGLFKCYNLMGKEIGYFILGYRLLCLGPSLIPHIPDSSLLHHQQNQAGRKDEANLQDLMERQMDSTANHESKVELRNSACMTEPIKQDSMMQTIELDDKAVNVAISSLNEEGEKKVKEEKVPVHKSSTTSASTQTEKRKKNATGNETRWIERDDMKVEDDGIIVNNIVCPPPLFYNSEAKPAIQIQRGDLQDQSNLSLDDLSEIESFDGQGIDKEKRDLKTAEHEIEHHALKEDLSGYRDHSHKKNSYIPQARPGEKVYGLPVAPQPETVFPLLTALINELAHIQNPHFLHKVSKTLQQSPVTLVQKHGQSKRQEQETDKISQDVVSAVAVALSNRDTDQKTGIEKSSGVSRSVNQNKTQQPTKGNKSAMGKVQTKKKTKLVYGLTNTQRLRLQKTNPAWLRELDKQNANLKSKVEGQQKLDVDELNETNFADTLTEVRRLAEKELSSTAGGDTLRVLASEVEEFEETTDKHGMKKYHSSKRPGPLRTSKVGIASYETKDRPSSRMESRQQHHRSPGKSKIKVRRARDLHQRNLKANYSSDSDEQYIEKPRPVPLERHTVGIPSPSLEANGQEHDEGLSARSELPSSRSRSIEVHLPSADKERDDNATISDSADSDGDSDISDDIPLPDDSQTDHRQSQSLDFQRFVSKNTSLPESIAGRPNASLNLSDVLDENSPLESTRHSRNVTEEQNDSRVLHSTDYDTKQFHSTDEPELQGLISEEENHSDVVNSGRHSLVSVRASQKFPIINPQLSENSPVPSVRRSTTKLDVGGTHSYLPSMSLSKGQTSPVSSRPGTPQKYVKKQGIELEPIAMKSGTMASRSSLTPRSAGSSPKRPTPRSRRFDYKASIHTDSLSSYMPSDPENLIVSLSSNSGNYSDDFQPLGSGESGDAQSSVEQLPKLLPSSKLGYTIG